MTRNLIEHLKQLKNFNEEIQKYSLNGGFIFLVDFTERILNWVSEHKSEASYYFDKTDDDLSALQQKNFNTHKAFVMELLLNMRDISAK